MAIVLDGTLGIQRGPEGRILNVVWFLYGLPDSESVPENVVFLNRSFGEASPQMIGFELDGEEYTVYADWASADEHEKASEVSRFYQTYGYILLAALRKGGTVDKVYRQKEWLVPVQYYDDYVTMINAFGQQVDTI